MESRQGSDWESSLCANKIVYKCVICSNIENPWWCGMMLDLKDEDTVKGTKIQPHKLLVVSDSVKLVIIIILSNLPIHPECDKLPQLATKSFLWILKAFHNGYRISFPWLGRAQIVATTFLPATSPICRFLSHYDTQGKEYMYTYSTWSISEVDTS